MKRSLIVILVVIPLAAIAAVAVLKASGDGDRRVGALVQGDAVALSWRGEWNEGAEYVAGNVVSYDGASYVAETEKLSTPEPECGECGWTRLAVENAAAETTNEAEEKSGGGYEIVSGTLAIPAGSSTGTTTVDCPDGKKVFGGGAYATDVKFSGPVGPGTPFPNGGVYGWRFGAQYPGGGATFTVSVVCGSAS